MAPDNPASSLEEFVLGIQARNPDLVKGALDAGIQPATAIHGRHPLWVLLRTGYEDLPAGLQTGMTRDEFSARTSAIVDTLFDRGVKVAEEGKYETPTQAYLADRFLVSGDVKDASTVVLHAINETLQDGRPAYRPDISRLITGLLASGAVPEGADYRDVIGYLVKDLENLHSAVRERLLNPKSDLEKTVAAATEKTAYWIEPLPKPDVGRILADLGIVTAQEGVPANEAAPGELAEKFAGEAKPTPDFVVLLDKKPPRQIINEMSAELVGLEEQKTDAKRLVFRQAYDKARADEALATSPPQSFNTAFMGYDGTGKSTLARKQAELLVALDLAGPNLVEITHDNLGKVAGSYTVQTMSQYFKDADILCLELGGGARDKEGKNIDDYLMTALQASLDGRQKPPVVLLSGWREDVEAALENCPGVKTLMRDFVTVPEPTIEQLGQALENRLANPKRDKKDAAVKAGEGFVIEKAARDYVLREFAEARKRLGSKGFRNMREVDAIAGKLPDALAERLFGSEENEQALTSSPDRKARLNTITLDDVRAINPRKMLGGPALMKSPGIGFHANL